MMSRSRNLALWTAAVLAAPGSLAAAELVHLDASTLPVGSLQTWLNSGDLGGSFFQFTSFRQPLVENIGGIRGVTFDGNNDYLTGPDAPASLTGNGDRTVIAWVFNPAVGQEETIIAWGRRGGPDRTLSAFLHGWHDTWGSFGGWGAGDVSWSDREKTGTWTCCSYVYDSTSGTFRAYTDGELSTSKVIGPLDTWAVDWSGGQLPIRLGGQNDASGQAANTNGGMTMARVRVYDSAFSEEQILNEFAAEAADFGLSPVVISSFSADRTTIYLGESVELSWVAQGASSVGIEPEVDTSGGSPVSVSPTDTTTYVLTATDGTKEATAQVTINVLPGAPLAEDGSVVAYQDTPASVELVATDPNTPVGSLTWEIVDEPLHGSLSGSGPAFTYTPDPGFNGEDSFTFRAGDGTSLSNTATFTIVVDPPPSAPDGVALSESSIGTVAVTGSFVGNLTASDPNHRDTHEFELVPGVGDDDNPRFAIVGNQLIAQDSFAGQEGSTFSIRVRATDSGGLSSEHVIVLTAEAVPQSVVITELFYDPPDNSRSEFVELHNPTAAAINLSGWRFTSGIDYTFPFGTILPAGGYLTVGSDPVSFLARFGFVPLGPYDGRLAGDGEEVVLENALGEEVDRVDYRATFPWPVSAGGGGPSMELIHPSLDNDLAGSWRASGAAGNRPQLTYIAADSTGWTWRPGTSEASFPIEAWRFGGFAEDSSWQSFQAPIGYGVISSEAGTVDLNTVVTDMRYNYSCIFLRKTFEIPAGEVPTDLNLRFTKDDGVLIWINGVLVTQRNMGTTSPTVGTLAASASDTEAIWYEEVITNAATLLVEGENTVAVQVFNGNLGSSDLAFDMELIRPAESTIFQPSPGEANTVRSDTAPPQLRQVGHDPMQPVSGEPIVVTAKATDPQGIGELRLLYQIVAPGSFIPARFPRTVPEVLDDPRGERPVNPAFEDPANWTSVPMVDDGSGRDAVAGDGVFTGVVPPQSHRTLVRYRVEAEDLGGESVRVPYADDESLNFACFVYDGVPDYVASAASVDGGPGKIWPREMLTELPVYHWIIRPEDMLTLQAYNSWEQFPNNGDDTVLAARRAEEWEGAFVYDGIVYDHVTTRLRGGNSRYGDFDGRFTRGKRHYKFRFNRGNYFQARNQEGELYDSPWKRLALNRMFGTKGGNGWGMPEEIGATLWRTFGVPAAYTHWIHFRVVDDAAEAPDQYHGDFWGLTQAVEEYESAFLENHDMEKGNLYKTSDWIWDAERQRRYQSPDMVSDGSEFNNIRDNLHGAQDAAWLERYVNYDRWYRYSAVAEGIRHYDVFPYINEGVRHALKNLAWYFEPTGPDPERGVCWFLPYDWDASFGPNFNNGWEHANNALYGWDMSPNSAPVGASYIDKPQMKLEHRNVLREFRDLIWQEDQIYGLMDDRAAVIAEFFKADMDRWRNAPANAGTGNDDPLLPLPGFGFSKLQDMKNFCFVGWNGGSGPSVGPGGRGAHLDNLADAADASFLPATPNITYTGEPMHPIDGLSFSTGGFSDPQGAGTFGAMEWRIGEIEDPDAPGWEEGDDYILEYEPVWLSGELTSYSASITVPAGVTKPGHTYRARVRMRDNTGRWSHWSAPHEFTTSTTDGLAELQDNLMITEVMYNPAGPVPASGEVQDLEYLELKNISETLTLDLEPVRFTKGADFDFAGSAVTELGPGEYVLVVKSLAAFEEVHGTGLPVAGEWDPDQNLSNGGEQIKLSYGAGTAIHDFTYDDVAPWPTDPDGGGPAMVLVDPDSAPDHSLPSSWSSDDPSPGGPPVSSDPFGEWLAEQGATDPDAEALPGMSWLTVYALGADLVDDPQSVLPRVSLVSDDDGDHLTVEIRRRADAPQVSYGVETSTSLITWDSGEGVVEAVGVPFDHGDGTVTETVRLIAPVSDEERRFVRVRILLD